MRFSFEWGIQIIADGRALVIERLEGSDLKNIYGPLPLSVAESVIKARRDFIHRTVTTRTRAIHIFEPRLPPTWSTRK